MLTYLLERDPALPRAALGGAGPRTLASPTPLAFSLPDWHHIRAAHILRRISEGAPLAEVAKEVEVEAEELRLAMRDVARRSRDSKRAELFTALAEGATVTEAARKLRSTKEELASELSPTKNLLDAVSATLLGRTQLPSLPEPPPRGPLKTMPVRFPEQQYERLKQWCEAHDFPMAVVVRGLVEHFLDQQERRAA